jgi:UPF0271 protein
MKIDINCDMGESFGRYTLGLDAEMMPLISSANIACGFHAGDPVVIRKTVRMAVDHGIGIGAHPGFPDLPGFGRRKMSLSPEELRNTIIYQVGALTGFAQVFGISLQHVKPHGALYNMSANNEKMGIAIVDALLELDKNLILFGLSGSKILKIARKTGLRVAQEVFADRAYHEDGTLVSRKVPGAVITDSSEIIDRVLKMTLEHKVVAITGTEIDLELDTICVHGDTPGAVEHVKHITKALRQEGIDIVPVRSFL